MTTKDQLAIAEIYSSKEKEDVTEIMEESVDSDTQVPDILEQYPMDKKIGNAFDLK